MDSFYEVQKMNDSGRGNNNKKQTLGENITTLPCPQTEVISLREDNEDDLTGKWTKKIWLVICAGDIMN